MTTAKKNWRRWSFVGKTAIVSAEHLDARTTYPQQGIVAGEIVQRSLDAVRQVVRINIKRPWNVESVEAVTRFDVLADSLAEW
jgi:hypothetical protein